MEIHTSKPVCIELYKDYKDLGRFMLRYGGETIAAGVVTEVCLTQSICNGVVWFQKCIHISHSQKILKIEWARVSEISCFERGKGKGEQMGTSLFSCCAPHGVRFSHMHCSQHQKWRRKRLHADSTLLSQLSQRW